MAGQNAALLLATYRQGKEAEARQDREGAEQARGRFLHRVREEIGVYRRRAELYR